MVVWFILFQNCCKLDYFLIISCFAEMKKNGVMNVYVNKEVILCKTVIIVTVHNFPSKCIIIVIMIVSFILCQNCCT